MDGPISKDAIVTLVSSFLGGFVMTWLRGYQWCGDAVTYAVALLGAALITGLLHAVGWEQWAFGIMSHALAVLGAVHVGGTAAKARASTNLPAAVLPQFNELSK